jgi:16S rRNA (guanine(966)-N(2))-methyltransferase RsmD
MRIISGRLKGRPLSAPRGHSLRPTSDQVKETLFNMLGAHVQQAMMLDLFAGTGNVGIEALSRGAEHAVFIEKNPRHFQILSRNIAECRVEADSTVYRGDANRLLLTLQKQQQQFDLAFVDPPYRHTNLLRDILRILIDLSLIAESGLLIVEHASAFTPPTELRNSFCLTKARRIGDTSLAFYQKSNQ